VAASCPFLPNCPQLSCDVITQFLKICIQYSSTGCTGISTAWLSGRTYVRTDKMYIDVYIMYSEGVFITHRMKAYWRVHIQLHRFYIFGTRWTRVVSVTTRPLHVDAKTHGNHVIRICVGMRICPDAMEIRKKSFLRPKLKTKLHGLSPRANYTDRATAACQRSDYQLLRI
jgi:hypothetical protein